MAQFKSRVRDGLFGVAVAGSALMVIAPQFSIIKIVYQLTGWKMPRWLAWIILGLSTAAAIVGLLATFGITIPAIIAQALKAATSASA